MCWEKCWLFFNLSDVFTIEDFLEFSTELFAKYSLPIYSGIVLFIGIDYLGFILSFLGVLNKESFD
jgi:hypothetical protein